MKPLPYREVIKKPARPALFFAGILAELTKFGGMKKKEEPV